MSTSIPVLNRNHSLPPLLLPASRSMKSLSDSADARHDPFSCYGVGTGNRKRSSSLEGLAQVATKKSRANSIVGDSNLFYDICDAKHSVAPVPLLSGSPIRLGSAAAPKSGFVSSSSSGSSSPAHPDLITRENRNGGTFGTSAMIGTIGTIGTNGFKINEYETQKNAMLASPQPAIVTCTTPISERNRRRSSNSGSSKRQRVGPSCDGCRLKKIKCDAQVEVLLQDPEILTHFSSKLHEVISRDQVSQSGLHVDVSEIPTDSVLVKHIDKIVMFRPCRSCSKHRASVVQGPLDGKNDGTNSSNNNNSNSSSSNSNNNNVTGGGCIFSKGFTRADINVFGKICKRIGQKSVQEMTVEDYHRAGF